MPAAARFGRRLAVFLLTFYAATALILWALQGALIYPAPSPRSDIPLGFERISYRTADGVEISAGYRPSANDRPTLLFFHGNGADWQSTARVTDRLAGAGFGVLAAEYRGYGGNDGTPSEAGLYADGRAAYAFLRRRGVAAEDIVLVGNSIGSGVATQLASEVEAKALILVSPFDSLTATAARRAWWLPVGLLLSDRYDNLAKLPRLDLPILILHGETDAVISVDQAERLARANDRAELVVYPDRAHALVVDPAAQDRIARFLADPPQPR